MKEIRVRPKTGEHDVETKINQARRFLEHKDKVLVNVQFRGRELQHIEEGRRIIIAILEGLTDVAKVEKPPSMEGKRMTAMLAPKASCRESFLQSRTQGDGHALASVGGRLRAVVCIVGSAARVVCVSGLSGRRT